MAEFPSRRPDSDKGRRVQGFFCLVTALVFLVWLNIDSENEGELFFRNVRSFTAYTGYIQKISVILFYL
jgi:hypothetical protein